MEAAAKYGGNHHYFNSLYKQAASLTNPEKSRNVGIEATMALMSAILCDPFQLSAYAGMAFLFGTIALNKKVAVEWCEKYRHAEDRLLSTPDEHLAPIHRTLKRQIKEPSEARKALDLMAKHSPHLLDGNVFGEVPSMRKMIDELEKCLLQ